MSEVVIALKRDAKADPPDSGRLVWTDRGSGYYSAHLRDRKRWRNAGGWTLNPQPSVWYDLRPTEGEPLTVDDLETAHDAAQMLTGSDFHKRDWPRMYKCQDRLRAALDALTKEES